MELTTERKVEANLPESFETHKFSIEASGKGFRIVIDGLYTHKIRAVIRELWTNAYDSHVAANMGDIPFDCHLPTLAKPVFIVRDYGTSMTHDEMTGLYTTIFASTKDKSNDAVGALGLGSKSPFAYTDGFSVIARSGTEKRTYKVWMDAEGTPLITLIATVESEEARGIEVSIAVKGTDIREFEQEARMLAAGFDPLPSIDGVTIKPSTPVYVGAGSTFAVFRGSDLPSTSQIMVRQGCVIYPIDHGNTIRQATNIIGYDHKMVIDVPIGAVNIAANREAVQLDERTIKNLTDACNLAAKQLQAEIYAEADKCATELDAMAFWYRGERGIAKFARVDPAYKGKKLNRYIDLDRDPKTGEYYKVRHGNRRTEDPFRNVDYMSIDQYTFVTHWDDKKVVRSAKRYAEFVKSRGGRYATNTILLRNPESAMVKMFKDKLGLKPEQVKWIGDLTDPGPPQRTASGTTGLSGVNQVVGYRSYSKVSSVPAEGDYYWFEVERTTYDSFQWWVSIRDELKTLGFDEKPVYTFTGGAKKRHKPSEKFELKSAHAEFLKKNHALWVDEMTNFDYNQSVRYARLQDVVKLNKPVDQTRYNLLCRVDNGTLRSEANKAAEKKMSELKRLYPLLFDSSNKDAVRWYIDARDKEELTRKVNP